MQSIIAHNENPIFVTHNMKESLVAVWSFDDGNDLALSTSNHSIGGSTTKWSNFDKLMPHDAENDVKKWEFYHCLVKSAAPHQEEKKEDNGEAEAEEAEAEEDEKQKTKSKSTYQKMFNKDSRIKSMIVDNVEQLNPIKMFGQHKRSASETNLGIMSADDRKDFVGQAVEDALSRAKKTFTLKQSAKKNNALDEDMGTSTSTKKTSPQPPMSPGGDGDGDTGINAFKDQYSNVMDIVFTNPIAMAKSKAFKARSTPQTPRKTLKDVADIPPIPEHTLSPAVTRQALGRYLDAPSTPSTPSTPSKRKGKSRKSKLQKALSASHLLRVDEGDNNTADDVAPTKSATGGEGKKSNKEGRRRRSSSVGAIEDDVAIKSKKNKKDKDKNRSRSSSTGRVKKTSTKLRKAMSVMQMDSASERPADDDDVISVSSAKSPRTRRKSRRVPKLRKQKSENDVDAPGSKRKSKKKKANSKLEVLNSRMKKTIGLEASPDSPGSHSSGPKKSGSLEERRARKRRSQQKLMGAFDKIVVDTALGGAVGATKTVGKTVGKGAKVSVDATKAVGKSVAKGAIGATKGAIGATKTVGKGAIGATKTVGKGAMDVTKGVTKGAVGATKNIGIGAIGVTKTVGKGAMDVTKTVGKGALDVTKGVGKAIGVSKSAGTAPPLTRTE
mmetsp:Transcript_43775/g.105586  ORF Transcript_43775/g.105586 Transcript_43775/m.105586 type:complete len:667 (+) Transcript_43775:315-2315(+)